MEADALWKSLRDFNERLENPPKTPGFPQLPQDPPLDLAREIKERDNYPDTGGNEGEDPNQNCMKWRKKQGQRP